MQLHTSDECKEVIWHAAASKSGLVSFRTVMSLATSDPQVL